MNISFYYDGFHRVRESFRLENAFKTKSNCRTGADFNQPSQVKITCLLPNKKFVLEIFKTLRKAMLVQFQCTFADIVCEPYDPKCNVTFKGQISALNTCKVFPIVAQRQLY